MIFMALAHVVIFLGHGDWRRRRWPAGRRRPWSAARWLRMPQIRDLDAPEVGEGIGTA